MQNETNGNGVGFDDLGLSPKTLNALKEVEYHTPSPIQAAFLPVAVKGIDCIGQARTGTGKTAAFVIPIAERLKPQPGVQALILAPTRELSEQVANEAKRLTRNRNVQCVLVVGGRPIADQVRAIQRGAEIVVGTPGRIIDLMNRRILDFSDVHVVVLDEADRMLDIGFRPDIEKILRRCPKDRQTMLLSATLPAPVERLAQRFMRNPERIDLSQDGVAAHDTIDQYYATVDGDRKFGLLVRLLAREKPKQALVFMRTKRGCDQLYRRFSGKLPGVAMMNGDLPQVKRDRVMKKFREGKIRLLIATDVVGRGIDVSGISHIVNYDIPEYHDDYIHRVGRTGRMTSREKGCAITFVTKEQGDELTRIEMRIDKLLPEYLVEGYQAYRPAPPRPVVSSSA